MEILIKALIISGFCVGLRIISSPGMIFYFLRMPYEYYSKYGSWREWLGKGGGELPKGLKRRYDIVTYLLKPVIGCGTCMASVWTIAIELGYFHTFTLQSVIIALIVAAMNSIFYAYYEYLQK